jgi:RNA polymerase sigma-70 factor (ECF subfamily)
LPNDADRLRASSDEDLARESRAGSVASFEELARRLQVPLIRFLSRRFPSRQDAEDLTQETLLQAYQSLAGYRDGRRFRTWVFTIAYRLAVSRGRAEKIAGEMPRDVADDREGPPAAMERREHEGRIWAVARDALSEEQVTALWLYYVEELSAGDVARVMRRSWVSVKTMLHRARKKLAPHLAAEVTEIEAAQSGGSR